MCLFALTQNLPGVAKGKGKKGAVSNTRKLESFLNSCFEPGHLARQLQQQQYEEIAQRSRGLSAQESRRTAWR